MDKNSLWQTILGQLEVSISRANFNTWFKNTELIFLEDDKAIISVPTIFSKEWLEKKYNKEIETAFRSVLKKPIKIEYKVGSSTKIKEEILEKVILKEEKEEAPVSKTNLNPRYLFENFVVGTSNNLAFAASQNVVGSPGQTYNPLFIYGGVGLGKTHLMQAVGNELVKNSKKRVVYVTSEKFTSDFISSLSNKNTNTFREKYRKVDVLLVDDMQFLAGKEQTREEFFHTFNTLYQDNKQIVITSDRPPKAIPTLEERLSSRFESGLIVDIQPPGLETRIAILKQKSQNKGIDLPLEVADYIARNIQKNIRELEGALLRLIAFCELNSYKPTLPIAQQTLDIIFNSPKKKSISPKEIIEKTALFYDLSINDIMGTKRNKEIVTPRQISMYLMRGEIDLSYPKIAKEFGGKDHTTVIHACSKIEKQLDMDETLRQEVNLIKERIFS